MDLKPLYVLNTPACYWTNVSSNNCFCNRLKPAGRSLRKLLSRFPLRESSCTTAWPTNCWKMSPYTGMLRAEQVVQVNVQLTEASKCKFTTLWDRCTCSWSGTCELSLTPCCSSNLSPPACRISYCTVDKLHDKVFAYIAQNTLNGTLECHAYLCSKRKVVSCLTETLYYV